MYTAQAESVDEAHTTKSKAGMTTTSRQLCLPGWSRAQSCSTIDFLAVERDAVACYWRLVGIVSSILILGGFLMLPATFERQPDMRVTQAFMGIFAGALVATGVFLTALLCFAVRNPLFHAEKVFLPAFTSCLLGFLTVFYHFLVFHRYIWNTPALLVTVAAAVCTIVYGALLVLTWHKVVVVRSQPHWQEFPMPVSQVRTESQSAALAPEQSYHHNYNQNMFPSTQNPAAPPVIDSENESMTEEDMQRQQMLMLLLSREAPSVPDIASSTFHIDWEGKEEEEVGSPSLPPAPGWFAPPSPHRSVFPPNSAHSSPGISPQETGKVQRWDGMWREVHSPRSQKFRREARRKEIEQGTINRAE